MKRAALPGKLHRRRARTIVSAIDHRSAARNVSRPVIDDRVVMPAHAPAMPSPAPRSPRPNRNSPSKTNTEPKAHAEKYSRRRRIVIARKRNHRRPVHEPRVIRRHIHHFRIRGRNCNLAAVVAHRLLLRRLKSTRLLRLLTHMLHCVHHILRLVVVGVTKIARPLHVPIHLRQHRRKRRQRLHAGIPLLRIRARRNLVSRSVALRLHPAIGFHNLRRIRRAARTCATNASGYSAIGATS